jgi:hypothetical protein
MGREEARADEDASRRFWGWRGNISSTTPTT